MIIINGYVNTDEVLLDDGYQFGLGVFETILVKKNKPLFLEKHCQRLQEGMEAFAILHPVDAAYIQKIVQAHNIHDCILKIIVSEKNIVVSTRSSTYTEEDYTKGLKVTISNYKRNPYCRSVYLKTTNYADNYLERQQAAKKGCKEALFFNIHDALCEGSASNVFFVHNKILHTPAISCGLLPGVVRSWVKEQFPVQEGRYTLLDVLQADEIFLTNSIFGIMKVQEIDGMRTFTQQAVYQKIRQAYDQYVDHMIQA